VQMPPHYMVKFLKGKKRGKKKKTRELRWEISNCGFTICKFQIQLCFSYAMDFFPSSSPCPS
jgi:hypothetical protein